VLPNVAAIILPIGISCTLAEKETGKADSNNEYQHNRKYQSVVFHDVTFLEIACLLGNQINQRLFALPANS
jgi:hypothetical protein